MGYFASKIKLSYEFSKAIPTDNPKYKDFQDFKKLFGDDGNTVVIGIVKKDLFTVKNFESYRILQNDLKNIRGVEDVLSVPGAVTLQKDSLGERLQAIRIFGDSAITDQQQLDSASAVFFNLPFYRVLMYNPATGAYLMAARVNKEIFSTKERSQVVAAIDSVTSNFSAATNTDIHLSGLPLIRTKVADRIQAEMKVFLIGSLVLSILMLLLFFRSITVTTLSLAVVIMV